MSYFSLDDSLKVWNSFIDSDHQRFADLLNEFQHAMVRGEGEDRLGEVLNELILYTREHFKREEDYMLSTGQSHEAKSGLLRGSRRDDL